MFAGSSPITFTLPSSKAYQKSGSFPPPALPGFNGRTDPVRLPPMPPPEATLRPLPSHQTGLPRLPEPPFRRAVPTTPADRAGAHVDCFPASRSLPHMAGGSASALSLSRPAQASLTLRPAGSLSRPQATFVTRLQPMRLPAQAARQLPDQSTTLRVDSSSTDDSRLRGALPSRDSCTAAGAFRFSPSPTQGTSMPRAGAVHHINSVVWGERTNTFLWSALPRDRATVNVAQDSRPARAGCSTRLPGWSPPHLPAAGTRAPRDPARRAGPGSRNHHGCDSAPRSTGGRRPRVPVALSLRRMRRRIRPAMQVNVCG